MGELQKSYWINVIILITKKVFFNAKKEMAIPRLVCIKRQVKLLFSYERLKYGLRSREDSFEKRWGIMVDYQDELK